MRYLFFAIALIICLACQPGAPLSAQVSEAPDMSSELFIRIIKTTEKDLKGVLETWRRGPDGKFHLDRRFPICTWSGTLGPKLREGDGQSPEGFYFVRPTSLNPNSSYHLSFNLGFPNAYDRAHDRTGSFLMVHGECVSIGCYAMTNDRIEDIYADVETAFAGGQTFIRVHIFPFEMTQENMATQGANPNHAFWENLKTGWDWFERDRIPPDVTVVQKTYQFSASE
jgi:murein L,D-transpeptidase YafK